MDIMVSVLMTVYNHERYLAKAIEGVLMQKTKFKYELIIGEDCSTDKSRDIVIAYQKKYPDIIKAMLNPVNLGMEKNGWQVTKTARGKYIAFCEGDDYWTDPEKLQMQIDFLESHLGYSGCYHSIAVVNENGDSIDFHTSDIFDDDSDVDIDRWPTFTIPGQTGTLVMRNVFSKLSPALRRAYCECDCNGDMKFPIVMLRYGKIRRIGKTMSCYRRTYTGDSYNARMRGKDSRFIYYFKYLERDRLAALFFERSRFPHYGCMEFLEGIVEEAAEGNDSAREKLLRMAAYDPLQFIAFLVASDIARLWQGYIPRLVSMKDMVMKRRREYVIFGTGEYGERCYKFLSSIKANIAECWDNDKDKILFHGLQVYAPHKSNKRWKIILATVRYKEEMEEQMEAIGYHKGEDFISIKKEMSENYLQALSKTYQQLFSL